MKSLNNLVTEAEENAAHKQAVDMGLKYRGFGYWEDPNSGQVKFKTEGETLVPVDETQMAEKGTKGAPDAAGQPQPSPGGLGTAAQMTQMTGAMPTPPEVGTLPLGAPEPGEELARTTMDWDPGPDGSTCVDSDQPPAAVPEDSFVNRTNNLKWGAGPDGTNYSNIDYDQLLKDLRSPGLDNFLNKMRNQQAMNGVREDITFFDGFMAEAPMQAGMGTRTAADEAKEQGLTYNGYGYWADKSGQVVAKTVDGQLQYIDQNQGGTTAATLDMGNPTSSVSGQTPASKARSMGLVSNGSGGYTDQQGNIIARTVNNELVFYDSRAGGGAVSDGSGGAMLTQSSPSWVDPVTGLIVVPPAQPESPEEIKAVPDPTPATAPAGYDAFVNRKKKEMYRDNYVQTQVNQEIGQLEQEAMAKWESTPELQSIKAQMDGVIERALESEDPYKQEIGERLQISVLENVDDVLQMYDEIDEYNHEELDSLIRPYLIAQVKSEYHNERVSEVRNDPEMDEDEKLDAIRLLDKEPSGQFSPDAFIRIEELKAEKEERESEIPELPDDVFGETYSGDYVTFDVTPFEDPMMELRSGELVAKTATKLGKEVGVKPDRVSEVNWYADETDDDDTNRLAALDALKVWRKQVLPDLTPGTVLYNEPQGGGTGGNQRERIYALAGFGDYSEEAQGQFGLVVDDNGKNVVIPLDFDDVSASKARKRKLREAALKLLDQDLNNRNLQVLYESLFR